MRRFLHESALSIAFGVLFVGALAGQAFAGWQQFNAQQVADGLGEVTLGRYLTSADFAVDVAENWQSEWLQFSLFILMTVWLVQKGSPESKELDRAGAESMKDQKIGRYARRDSPAWAKTGDWRTTVFSNSLILVMGTLFLASWLIQSIAGWAAFNQDRLQQQQDPIGWGSYLVNADFWARTLQNWQSEFLAVGTMVVFSVYLRQRGSPESKPVGEPHTNTGVEG
jgi:uncharacterized protein DUF6766